MIILQLIFYRHVSHYLGGIILYGYGFAMGPRGQYPWLASSDHFCFADCGGAVAAAVNPFIYIIEGALGGTLPARSC